MSEIAFLLVVSFGYLMCIYQIYLCVLAFKWCPESDNVPVVRTVARRIVMSLLWMGMFGAVHGTYTAEVSVVMAFLPTLMFITMMSDSVDSTIDILLKNSAIETRWHFVMFNTVLGRYI